MSLKFNTLYDFDNINNDLNNDINTKSNINSENEEKNINIMNKSKSIEKEIITDLTKNFVNNALNNKIKSSTFKEEPKIIINPSNININNQNIYTMFKLEYTIIQDFLIRTNLNFTKNIFNKEMKSILKTLIPFSDGELASLLGINLKELTELRFKWNNSESKNYSENIIKSTYLYHILNQHTKITKIDTETQTDVGVGGGGFDENNFGRNNYVDTILKKLEDKYEKKNKEKNDFYEREEKYKKYKEELDEKYEQDLKNEMERFKSTELAQMRIDENKKYLMRIEKLRKEYQEEYNKKYEEIKKIKENIKEKELKLYKDFEERNMELKKQYEEKEKILDEKKSFLDKKYKNEKNEMSVQIIKFNEELDDIKKSFFQAEKEKKLNDIKNNNELNPLINREIENLRNQIDEIKLNIIKKNNFIKDDEDKNKDKINSNINIIESNKINKNSNIKPSKKSVINSLELFSKNNNNINNINKSKSSNSQSGSGAYNSNSYNNNIRTNPRKEIMKRFEDLEEEQYQMFKKYTEDLRQIYYGEGPLFNMDREQFMINNENNYMKIAKYKPNDIENITINKNINNYNTNNKINNNNDINNININTNINDNKYNNINNNINENKYNNINNNNMNNKNNISNQENNINNISKNNSVNNKETIINTNTNNIGGFNIGGYNPNLNNNNIYNFPIKGESESIIEENIEGGENMNNPSHIKKENKKNNFLNSNKYQDQTNPIKEDIEGESGGSNNNSRDNNNIINPNKNNNINVAKSNNKFNNYDLGEFEVKNDSKDEVKNEGEIDEEIINYGVSGGVDDLSGKRKDKIISASISGIAKKQYEVSESAGGFRGLLQMQGLGGNFKDEKDEFEFSKGKGNYNNLNNNNNMNQRTESGKISEEIESDGPF